MRCEPPRRAGGPSGDNITELNEYEYQLIEYSFLNELNTVSTVLNTVSIQFLEWIEYSFNCIEYSFNTVSWMNWVQFEWIEYSF